MPFHAQRTASALAVLAAAALVVAGCSTPTSRGRETAEASVGSLLDSPTFHGYVDEVVEWAERVEEAAQGTGIVMIDVEEMDTEVPYGTPIGRITVGVTVSDSTGSDRFFDTVEEQDPGPHCVEITFEHWGVVGTRPVDCPDGELVAMPVPPSRRPHIAVNAEDAVWSVLSSLPDDPPSEEHVVAAVTALLEPHANGVTPLAPVTVAFEDGSIAVATGDDDECVLVARGRDGQVRDIHVPSVYLKEGELGCTASTAFADLRPPH